TLVEVAEHPDRVQLPSRLPMLLTAVQLRLHGAVALVSGRRLDDVDRWLKPFRFAGAGLHGLELRRMPDAHLEHFGPHVDNDVRFEVRRAVAGIDGVWVEDKGRSIAIHYRAAPIVEQQCIAVAVVLAERFGLRIVRGKMVVELKVPGADKGTALEALMRVAPFTSRRPVFVGDDVTDEDGFAAATRLGGFGVRIGDGPTHAQVRLPSVDAALGWLERGVLVSAE
ncbi:MAG TPA: trehalose-phosphatase, partial [Xanthomonadales bacterium]|nr:trehalose-phosphatase [Xanthomonadales bacterium]